jgi:predicted DNA-binding transcriptional regulator YafY
MIIKEAPSIYAVKEREYAIDIHLAIISVKKIKTIYTSLSSGRSERIIRPYGIINYKGSPYLVGYCENRKRILSFKISRFQSVELLNDKYVIPEGFSLNEFAGNSLGIYNDDIFSLKLRIDWPMSYIISEKKWVDNQVINWIDDKTIIFEAEMAGKTEIISWILSMGENVNVLEPVYLKDEIRSILSNMINNI